MNHNYLHCIDYKPDCPDECFRAQLTKDLLDNPDIMPKNVASWMHFRGSSECEKDKQEEMNNKHEYHVSYMCVYSDVVEASSPEEAALRVQRNCPYDIDGTAEVVRIDTDESWEI